MIMNTPGTDPAKQTVQNPFASKPSRSSRLQPICFQFFRIITYAILLCAIIIFGNIIVKGLPALFQSSFPYINTDFFTKAPESLHIFEYQGKTLSMGDSEYRAFLKKEFPAGTTIPESVSSPQTYVYSAGGIFPCIVGTVLLVVGSVTIALLLGIASAIYLSEYARDTALVRFIRLCIVNLAGIPSIVFGLFGFGLFVIFFGWNVSLLAGWFTLAIMVLPIIITAAEESLRAVPRGFREGSLALGATRWQTIRKNVLPYALPGILTSSILAIARVAGETAPIMFTAAYVVRDKLPWEVDKISDFFFQGVMALPYHIYVVSSKIPQNEYTERIQYGTALVFLLLVAAIATASVLLRNKLKRSHKW